MKSTDLKANLKIHLTMAEKKEPVLCYFHFMYNEWNEQMAQKVFADASCGWEYLWQKWMRFCDNYGYYGAIMMYYAEGLDNKLQKKLSTAAYDFYNGR